MGDHKGAPLLAMHNFAFHIIKNAESTDSNGIRDALVNIADLDTILGKFSMDASGQAVYDPIIIVVNNGEFEVFK